jgi:hypothetical protein
LRVISKNLKIIDQKYNTINLPVVLYERGNRSFFLREENILKVFKNRILRRIDPFEPKRPEEIGD